MSSDEKKVNDVASNAFKEQPEDEILSFEAFVAKYIGSFEKYLSEMKAVFPESPEKSDDEWRKLYDSYCRSSYNSYVERKKNPYYNPALILSPDDFEDD